MANDLKRREAIVEDDLERREAIAEMASDLERRGAIADIANDFERRGAIVMLPNVARPLRSKLHNQKLRGELCPRRRNATCLREGCSPKGASKTSQVQVVPLTELDHPQWSHCERIKVIESDLRRYGGNLDILRQCAAEHAAIPRIPVAGKPSPCGAAGGCIVGTSSLKDERSKGATTNLPRFEGFCADFDELSRQDARAGSKASIGSSNSTAAPSTNNSRAASSQCTRRGERKLPSGAPSTSNSRASSQCTAHTVNQRGRRPCDDVLSFVS